MGDPVGPGHREIWVTARDQPLGPRDVRNDNVLGTEFKWVRPCRIGVDLGTVAELLGCLEQIREQGGY